MHAELVSAIRDHAELRFRYDGTDRVVEPQTYGISICGREVLRARQVNGSGRPQPALIGKLFLLEKIKRLRETGRFFQHALPQHNPHDMAMQKIFATLARRKIRVFLCH